MAEIGYVGNLFAENYSYQDFISKQNKLNVIDGVGFAQTPTSYRNACISILVANGTSGAAGVKSHRAVGSPLCLEITETSLNRWKVTDKEPELIETVRHEEIPNLFNYHKIEWSPESIFRAKSIGKIEGGVQLDFFDIGLFVLLENQAPEKLDRLLRETLQKIIDEYNQYHQKPPNFRDIFRLVFRLIVAKVMVDRKNLHNVNLNDAFAILRYVEDYYDLKDNPVLVNDTYRDRIIEVAWKAISNGISFHNLSVDDFAFIYERTLIEKIDRKRFGIHSTPPRIAEYIVNKLPFEDINEADRYVLEPCAGHGGFLVSALRRLKELLSPDIDIDTRHKYLVNHLSAIELDSFALEACWSRLVLADYPHRNGWLLHQGNVFEGNLLSKELEKARILLCNPPFESFSPEDRLKYNEDLLPQQPVELLRRIMQKPPELLGLVLPQSFETGISYRKFHRQLAESYDNIEFLSLPEVFNFSDAITTLVLASGKRDYLNTVYVKYRRIESNEDKKNFLSSGIEPPAIQNIFTPQDYLQSNFNLLTPPLSKIWEYLDYLPKLSDYIDEIHRGVRWKKEADMIKQNSLAVIDHYEKGYRKGANLATDNLMQYYVKTTDYLSFLENDQYNQAYLHAWEKKKVICNAGRLSRNCWRFGAVADAEGLAFSNRFIAIWTKEKVSDFALAAVLNSPLANAFIYTQETGREVQIRNLVKLPVPYSLLELDSKIDKLSRQLHKDMENGNYSGAKRLLLKIDAEILREYDLPSHLERELLDFFQGYQRPVPFEFKGYYPDGYSAYLPLYELISNRFQESRADRLLERMHFIEDDEVTKALSILHGELEDEDEHIPA